VLILSPAPSGSTTPVNAKLQLTAAPNVDADLMVIVPPELVVKIAPGGLKDAALATAPRPRHNTIEPAFTSAIKLFITLSSLCDG
jgi:hypothetical protein